MSTMPPAPMVVPARTPVAPAGPAARATATEEGAESATVADVFAALVDALTAQLDGAAAEPAEGDAAGQDEAEASAHEAAPGEVVLPMVIAPVVRLSDAATPTGDPAEEPAAGAGAVPEGGAVVAVDRPAPTVGEGPDAEPVAASGPHGAALDGPADVEQPGAPLGRPVEHAGVTVDGAEPLAAGDATGPLRDDEVVVGAAPGVRPGDVPGSLDVTATAARVATAAPTAAPAADPSSAAADRPVAPALPEQLVEVLTPVRRGPDGDHRMSIQLRPEELGEVRIDVRVRGGEISLNLRADLPATSELLRDSLRELRVALEAAGFRSGDLDVGSHGRGGATPDGSPHRGPAGAASQPNASADAAGPPARPTASTPTAGLDLRL